MILLIFERKYWRQKEIVIARRDNFLKRENVEAAMCAYVDETKILW